MRLLLNQAPHLPAYISTAISAGFLLIYIFIICDAADKMSSGMIRILNTSFPPHAVASIFLFLIKGGENGKLGHTTFRVWIKYIIIEIFRQIGRGLNNVHVLRLRHITRKYDHFLDII
jgi:hypothetical protein